MASVSIRKTIRFFSRVPHSEEQLLLQAQENLLVVENQVYKFFKQEILFFLPPSPALCIVEDHIAPDCARVL